MKPIAALFAALALTSATACGTDEPKTENDVMRSQFTESMGENYSFTWQYGGFFPDDVTAPTRVTVRDNVVTAVIDIETGDPVGDQFRGGITTIDGVFDLIAHEQEVADEVIVTYDPATGIPTHLNVDAIADAEDDGFSLQVSDVVAE